MRTRFLPRWSQAAGLILLLILTGAGVLLSAAPRSYGLRAQATPPAKIQALVAPGSLTLPPGGYGVVAWPAPAGYTSGTRRMLYVHNLSGQSADMAIDSIDLTIAAPAGYIAVPDAACSPQDALNVSVCPLAGIEFVAFDAADAAHPQPLPQQQAVRPGTSLALSAAPEGSGTVAAVAVAYDPPGAPGEAGGGIGVAWDGASLVLSAPDRYKIAFPPYAPYGDQGCTPNDDVPTAVTCPATGVPPRLVHASTLSLNPLHFPPRTRRVVFVEIVSPSTSSVQAVGQPVSFAANGPPDIAYLWDFGDGTAAAGQVARHSFAAPGLYTATLTIVDENLGQSSRTRLVSVGQPAVTVTYPAGWNLIGFPSGTTLSGVLGPLYSFGFPACAPIPTTATPSPEGTPAAVAQPQQSCNTSYKPVPPDQALAVGAGYWASFPRTATVTLPFVDGWTDLISGPPGSYLMIGNPTFKPAVVRGADAVYVYDTTSGSYRQTDTLQPGQGAWAYSVSGGTATLSPSP